MPAYLGNLGSLMAIECEVASVEAEDSYVFDRSLEGKRRAQYRRLRPRSWEIEMGLSSSSETANVRALDAGEFGFGPFIWCTEEAQATNLLTPAQSSCDPSTLITSGITAAGPLDLGVDGWAGRSFSNPTAVSVFNFGAGRVPVLPGIKVTGSAYLVGLTAAVRVYWWDASGAFISSSTSSGGGLAGVAKRLSVTGTAPANAAAASVAAVNAERAARPALTWTPSVAAWAPGGGCPKAVISKLENAAALLGATQSYSQVKFTVMEVG